jgi:two-component system response regulator YesN
MAYIIQIISERTDDTGEVLRLYSMYKKVQDSQNLRSLAKLAIEFCLFCNELSKSSVVVGSMDIVGKVIKYVDDNFMEHLRISDIAEHFFVNSAYLGQQFIKKKGYSLNHYINAVRIEKSKELLLNTNLKIYEIAEKVGFDDPNYFSAKYYEYTNQTPSEFRQKGSVS